MENDSDDTGHVWYPSTSTKALAELAKSALAASKAASAFLAENIASENNKGLNDTPIDMEEETDIDSCEDYKDVIKDAENIHSIPLPSTEVKLWISKVNAAFAARSDA